ADELSVAALDQEPDEHRCAEERREECHRGGDEHALHVPASTGTSMPTSRSPSQRSPASRLDLRRTTSPDRSCACRSPYASSASVTTVTSVCAPVVPAAPSAM